MPPIFNPALVLFAIVVFASAIAILPAIMMWGILRAIGK